MPLTGEYAPGTSDWARRQSELYEATNGEQGADLRGRPVIVLTSVVASRGGAARNPVWYYNLKKNPHVELQDGAMKRDYRAREVDGDEKAVWWERAVAV